MLDSFGRNIDYLRVSVTDRCNLRCVYCMPAEGVKLLRHEEIISFEQIAAVAAAAEPRPALPEIPLAEMNELEIQQLRRDIGQLRTEQDFLRSELVAMRLDMNEIQGTLARAEDQAQQPQAAPK